MAEPARVILRQLDTAWALTSYHLESLSTDECLWRPAPDGLHVQLTDGRWRAEWPTHEGYSLGPASIAWITWHIDFWWTMVLDHHFGDGLAQRELIDWAGSADAACARIQGHYQRWRTALESLEPEAWSSVEHTRWPFRDRPLSDVAAWVNIELTKNAAELGYARFLYAVRPDTA